MLAGLTKVEPLSILTGVEVAVVATGGATDSFTVVVTLAGVTVDTTTDVVAVAAAKIDTFTEVEVGFTTAGTKVVLVAYMVVVIVEAPLTVVCVLTGVL